jgi:hypothetical protein
MQKQRMSHTHSTCSTCNAGQRVSPVIKVVPVRARSLHVVEGRGVVCLVILTGPSDNKENTGWGGEGGEQGGQQGGSRGVHTCLGRFCVELTGVLLLGERFGVWSEVSGKGGGGGEGG